MTTYEVRWKWKNEISKRPLIRSGRARIARCSKVRRTSGKKPTIPSILPGERLDDDASLPVSSLHCNSAAGMFVCDIPIFSAGESERCVT